jgi:hypothetical protein
MHHRLIGLTALLALLACAAAAPALAGSGRLPKLIVGTWSGIKPKSIDFSADGGNVVGRLRWSSWTHTKAAAKGVSDIQSCVPSCYNGKEKRVSTRITLSRPRDGHFTEITEVRAGIKLVARYRTVNWPIYAS